MTNEIKIRRLVAIGVAVLSVTLISPIRGQLKPDSPAESGPPDTSSTKGQPDSLLKPVRLTSSSCTPVRLTKTQINQIKKAQEGGTVQRLSTDRNFTYTNSRQIVTDFTKAQKASILGCQGAFFKTKKEHTAYPNLDGVLWSDAQQDHLGDSSRHARSSTQYDRACPRTQIASILYTALNADDQPVQIVQFDSGYQQFAIREECDQLLSVFVNNVHCMKTVRIVYMVAIRLDSDPSYEDIAVQAIQVESCSSMVSIVN